MEKLKKKWDEEFPEKTHYSTKGLRNNASRFKKEGKRSRDLENPSHIIEEPNMKEKMKCENEKIVQLVQLEEQAKNEGTGFMKRLKKAWEECYPEFWHLAMQCLRGNARRFRKDKTFTNLTLVRNREEVSEQLLEVPNDVNNEKIEENENRPGRENQSIMGENEQTSQEEIEVRDKDRNLRELFQAQMERVMTTAKDDIEERKRLTKIKLIEKIKQCANRIMENHP